MATVTVTETGVTIVVQLNRDESGDSVQYSANSITNVPAVPGRATMGVDITGLLTAPQVAVVAQVLDFIEARVKANWDIP